MPSRNLCLQCKGRGFCGEKCVILERHRQKARQFESIKGTEFSGASPPGVFVSWNNYPNISFSALSASSNNPSLELLDRNEQWFGLSQEKIISMRQQMLSASKKFNAFSAAEPSREMGVLQEIALSSGSLGVELKLKNKPSVSLDFNELTAPMGMHAEAEKIILTENPKIYSKAEHVSSDTDAKAIEGAMELLDSGIPLSFIQKIFSAGLLGMKKNRRLVPTRWSITALDSNLSEQLINEKILFFPEINSFQLFESNYLDNHFFLLLVPGSWSFEMLELWAKGSTWSPEDSQAASDFESARGRKDYASNIGGAYYAARLAIALHLSEKKRQASAIIFRKISQGYDVPLGVWVIRETVKDALKRRPLEFFDLSLALKYISNRLGEKEFLELKSKSQLLPEVGKQKKLFEFA